MTVSNKHTLMCLVRIHRGLISNQFLSGYANKRKEATNGEDSNPAPTPHTHSYTFMIMGEKNATENSSICRKGHKTLP